MNIAVRSLVPGGYLQSIREAGLVQSVWKFVVIETPVALHFVCGPVAEYAYHANLVARYCNRYEIGAIWARKPDLVGILDTSIKVRGGGHIEMDLQAYKMKIHGRSTAYCPYNPEHLIGLGNSNSFVKDFELAIAGL